MLLMCVVFCAQDPEFLEERLLMAGLMELHRQEPRRSLRSVVVRTQRSRKGVLLHLDCLLPRVLLW